MIYSFHFNKFLGSFGFFCLFRIFLNSEFKVYSAHEVGLNDLSIVNFCNFWNYLSVHATPSGVEATENLLSGVCLACPINNKLKSFKLRKLIRCLRRGFVKAQLRKRSLFSTTDTCRGELAFRSKSSSLFTSATNAVHRSRNLASAFGSTGSTVAPMGGESGVDLFTTSAGLIGFFVILVWDSSLVSQIRVETVKTTKNHEVELDRNHLFKDQIIMRGRKLVSSRAWNTMTEIILKVQRKQIQSNFSRLIKKKANYRAILIVQIQSK